MAAGIAVKPDVPRPARSVPAGTPSGGFAARLDGASLADLVQIECMRGVKRVIRVTSEARYGFLYFDQGQVVHAATAGRVGESAALFILGWKTGTFEACEQVWPVRHTIHTTCQALVLRAAQQEDEAKRDAEREEPEGTSEASGISPVPARVREMAPANEVAEPRLPEPEEQVVAESSQVPKSKAGVLRAVRLDRDGNVLSHVGPALGDFADVASYTLRLCSLIGESLGLENFMGLECTSAEKSFLAFWDKETVVALEAQAQADIESYKKRAGL
jgi:hypothetical protein